MAELYDPKDEIWYQCYICLKDVDRIYPVDAYTTHYDMCKDCLLQLILAAEQTHDYYAMPR